jgi:hypothetical protein
MFGRRRLRGTALLDSVVAQFDQMVTDLLAASAQINEDVKQTQAQMDLLRNREVSLINAEARAHRVRENLEKLVE